MKPFSSLLTSVGIIFYTTMLQYSNGQFPVECMDDTNLRDRVCCPNMCSNQGTCTDLNIAIPSDPYNSMTVRDNWPHYFTSVCVCNGNYAGFDCSRCKYGYYGSNCSQKMVLPRRPISELTNSEWTEYINILKASKNFQSGYFIFLEEPTGSNIDLTTLRKTPVNSLYDLFIWQHHYAAKDNEQQNENLKVDYAHESTGFPTWHRQYLLWLEWELQYMLKETRPDTYYMFRFHYWDWRKERQSNENSPFKSNRLGMTVNISGFPRVQGDLVSDGWSTRCWRLDAGEICNPNDGSDSRGIFPLQRCPFRDDPCNISNKDWPTNADVTEAVSMQSYDGDEYDRFSTIGFRNYMEGFDVLSNDQAGRDVCSTNRLCLCGSDSMCANPQSGIPVARQLHNSVHIILGVADFNSGLQSSDPESGVMADVAASSGDPIFINHHAMVDCILEEWLQKNKNAQYPQDNNQIPQGHKQNNYLVPFYPLVTHSEMFKTADNFGYSCSLSAAIKLGPTVWFIMFMVLGGPLVTLV